VILYDLGVKGYHTPLTREQIAELFHAGRVDRHHPCKPTAKSEWRTIDELFPLLKYDSACRYIASIDDSRRLPAWPLFAGASVILVAAISFLYVSSRQEQAQLIRAVESPPLPQPYSTSATTATPVLGLQQPSAEADQRTNETSRERARLEQERFNREQLQRQQAALADRMRADEASAKARRDEGTDVVCPLDQTIPVNVGGLSVTVKIHDNDVTTFDAWINGRRMHEVQKQKGISHSRTDETLLYQSGRASLYYVWEISGELNHCLLRVREE
jgi:hypothetical protein